MLELFFLINFLIIYVCFFISRKKIREKITSLEKEFKDLTDYLKLLDPNPILITLNFTKIEFGEGTGKRFETKFSYNYKIMPRDLETLNDIFDKTFPLFEKKIFINLWMNAKAQVSLNNKEWLNYETFESIVLNPIKKINLEK